MYDFQSKGQILRKSSTPTVTTNGNCATGVGACSTSPAARVSIQKNYIFHGIEVCITRVSLANEGDNREENNKLL